MFRSGCPFAEGYTDPAQRAEKKGCKGKREYELVLDDLICDACRRLKNGEIIRSPPEMSPKQWRAQIKMCETSKK